MRLYGVTAINDKGQKTHQIIELEDNENVADYMEMDGSNVLSIKKLPSFYRFLRFRQKINPQDIVELIENLHLTVRSGLPISSALSDLAKDADNNHLQSVLENISNRVHAGMTLSKALSRHSGIFSDITVNLVRIGEETGKLDNTLKDAAEHMKKMNDLTTKTKSALIYPSFALVGMILTMVFWLVAVMPKMISAFKSFQIDLPPATKLIMGMSGFFQSYFIETAIVSFVFVSLHLTLRKTQNRYKYITDKLLLKTPVFGQIIRNYNYAFIAEYLRLMISAGLPLYLALTIMEESLTNSVYKRSIEQAKDGISMGKSFSEALKEQNLYPNVILRMVSIGEQTGNLDVQLGNIAENYYYKVDCTSTNISKMIEPLIIAFIGAFMLVIMLGLMGPVFSLITNMPI
ncbi:type II secretion system F family protein [Deferribacteres bacterium DY0609]